MSNPWYADRVLVGYPILVIFGFWLTAMLLYRPIWMRRFFPELSTRFMQLWGYANLAGAVWFAVIWIAHVVAISD
jgi:hypothetical protein